MLLWSSVIVDSVAGGELVDTLDDVTVHARKVRAFGYMAIYDYKNICSICRETSNVNTKENKLTWRVDSEGSGLCYPFIQSESQCHVHPCGKKRKMLRTDCMW